MLRYLFLLLIVSQALAIDPAYKPHKLVVSRLVGFAVNEELTGKVPSTDKVWSFSLYMFYQTNPPLTPTEATRLTSLESWAKTVSNPKKYYSQFMELSYLRTKNDAYLNKPIELNTSLLLEDGSMTNIGKFELIVDMVNSRFPGQPIDHKPVLFSVTEKNFESLPSPYVTLWQPIALRGLFKRNNATGQIVLFFRRHQNNLKTFGYMNTGGKKSVIAHATYNGQWDCEIPRHSLPPWTSLIDQKNWKESPVNFGKFGSEFVVKPNPINDPLPNY